MDMHKSKVISLRFKLDNLISNLELEHDSCTKEQMRREIEIYQENYVKLTGRRYEHE